VTNHFQNNIMFHFVTSFLKIQLLDESHTHCSFCHLFVIGTLSNNILLGNIDAISLLYRQSHRVDVGEPRDLE
jgi:hypothetical protein